MLGASGMASTRTPSSRAAAAVVGPMTATAADARAWAPQRARGRAARTSSRRPPRRRRAAPGGSRTGSVCDTGHDVDEAAARGEHVAQVLLASADGLWEQHARAGREIGQRRREPLLPLVVGGGHDGDDQAGVGDGARRLQAHGRDLRPGERTARACHCGARRRGAHGRRAREHDPVRHAGPASAASNAAQSGGGASSIVG